MHLCKTLCSVVVVVVVVHLGGYRNCEVTMGKTRKKRKFFKFFSCLSGKSDEMLEETITSSPPQSSTSPLKEVETTTSSPELMVRYSSTGSIEIPWPSDWVNVVNHPVWRHTRHEYTSHVRMSSCLFSFAQFILIYDHFVFTVQWCTFYFTTAGCVYV